MATIRISLKKVKIAERRLNLLNGSRLLLRVKKILPFVQSYKETPPLHHPKNDFMIKWHLIQPLRREIYKKPTLISYILVRSKNLWSRITLYRACTYVFRLSTPWFQHAPIGSPIICMRSPAVICEQWERNLTFSSADVRGQEPFLRRFTRRDEPLRTSAWETTQTFSFSFSKLRYGTLACLSTPENFAKI